MGSDGSKMRNDLLKLRDESQPGQPLLTPVMQGGRRLLARASPWREARQRFGEQLLACLPEAYRRLEAPPAPAGGDHPGLAGSAVAYPDPDFGARWLRLLSTGCLRRADPPASRCSPYRRPSRHLQARRG
jgi:hypothetical protein